jgi:uncharacterized protein (UPF0276 family)
MRRRSQEDAHQEADLSIGKVGLGLRWELIDELAAVLPSSIDFLEVAPENYVGRGGAMRTLLARLGERYPLLTHGLTMSLGGTEPLDRAYLEAIGGFIREVKSPWHSDHLSFGASAGKVLHDLLPIAFTEREAVRIADRVKEAQDRTQVPMAIENISFYMRVPPTDRTRELDEPEFLTQVCAHADCGLMLDVNNAYVNSKNFGFDVDAWMARAPLERVVQIHVAGHEAIELPEMGGSLVIDTHGAPVPDPVLALLGRVLPRTGPVPVVLERDQAIPTLAELVAELDAIRAIYDRAFSPR